MFNVRQVNCEDGDADGICLISYPLAVFVLKAMKPLVLPQKRAI